MYVAVVVVRNKPITVGPHREPQNRWGTTRTTRTRTRTRTTRSSASSFAQQIILEMFAA